MPFYSDIAIACLLVIAETVLTTGQGCEDIACPAIWSPVCGADGKTYSNQCAACEVDVACEGECPCSGGEFCGDKKCNLKCKAGEKCVENEEVQCVQAPCCPRWTCQQDPCLGKPCGTSCDTYSGLLTVKSSGLLPAILPAIRYCQPDGTCGINSKPNCTEELKEEGESCGSCFCPPTYNAGTCKPGLTCVHHPLIADLPGTCIRTNCETCESMVQGQKCGQDILAALDGGPLRMNCTDCCRTSSQCAEWRCDAGGWLCQKTCPSEVGCEDVRKCNMAFGEGEVGVCIQTNKEGWNVKTNIDWSAPMKTGLCKSKDDTDANCCGCFKEKVDRCEDPKCVSIPKKKIERKCIKKSEDAPDNLFNTGRKCQKRDDCFCFQNCKTNKKCKKSRGECLGKPPKWPYQKAAVKPCDKKKKCSCYIPITLIIPG